MTAGQLMRAATKIGVGTLTLMVAALALSPASAQRAAADPARDTIATRIEPPAGFTRVRPDPGSFGAYLQNLKLKPDGAAVHLFNGARKWRQDVQAAVIDIDVGEKDLQQCADAVMRLRAEWLYAAGRTRDIAFNDTGGGRPMSFARWADGERPRTTGNKLVWSKAAAPDPGYASFRRYLDSVFTWAGTYSLERELRSVSARDVEAGDVVIRGGFPGHALIVVDVARNAAGERRVLLAQSFMPAQEIHVVKNFASTDGSPWYALSDDAPIMTPEWSFPTGSLKRWP
jgi:hypothetical protein